MSVSKTYTYCSLIEKFIVVYFCVKIFVVKYVLLSFGYPMKFKVKSFVALLTTYVYLYVHLYLALHSHNMHFTQAQAHITYKDLLGHSILIQHILPYK